MSWKAFFIVLCLLSSFSLGFPAFASICNCDYDWREIVSGFIAIILFSLSVGLFFGVLGEIPLA